jgi:hypothetical protein
VNHAPPIDILKMAVLAPTNKANGRYAAALPIVPAVVDSLWSFQLLEPHKPSPIRRITRKDIAHEPMRENFHPDLWRRSARIAQIEGRRSQLWIAIRRKAAVVPVL